MLGVSPEGSTEAIKRAYYRRVRAYHPDAPAGSDGAVLDEAQAAMAGPNAAWNTLRDERLRADYDEALAAASAGSTAESARQREADGSRARPSLRWAPASRPGSARPASRGATAAPGPSTTRWMARMT